MSVTGAQIVAARTKYKGVPYSQRNPQDMNGMDCSGVIQAIMRDVGISISRTTSSQLADAVAGKVGSNIGVSLADAQPGDILHYPGHEEMWLGGGQVFSEATYGTVADDRGKTPETLLGIVRYSDGAGTPSPAGSTDTGIAAIFTDKSIWVRVFMFLAGVVALSVVVWEMVRNG